MCVCLYTYTLYLLITYVCFYITLDPFPVVSLGYFVYNGIDATVANMGGRVDLPQDLFFLFFIGDDFLADVCVWLTYTNTPVSAIISYNHSYIDVPNEHH